MENTKIPYFQPSLDEDCNHKKTYYTSCSWNLTGKTQTVVKNIKWNPAKENLRPVLFYPWWKKLFKLFGLKVERSLKIEITTN